jgi:hypothetical protein
MKRFLLLAALAGVGLLFAPTSLLAQGKFSGVFYGDYFYNAARDTLTNTTNLPNSALTGPKSLQGFVIRRVYFTYDYDLAEQFATRFRLEVDQTPNSSGSYVVLQNGNTGVFVKDAWLRWKNIVKGSDFYFGVSPTAAYEISEQTWSYRSLEKTIMDLRGIVSSRHLGADLRGKFDEDGMFGYWLTVANANSGNQPKDQTAALKNGDKYNLYSLNFSYRPVKPVVVTLYGDFRPTYPVNDPASTSVPKATVSNNAFTGALFASYKQGNDYAIGLEGFMQQASNAYALPTAPTDLKSLKRMGISVWVWYNFNDDLGAVARFDYYDPKSGSDVTEKGDIRNYILGSVVYKPAKNVQFMPNVQVETYESLPNGGRSIKTAVTARLTTAFSF